MSVSNYCINVGSTVHSGIKVSTLWKNPSLFHHQVETQDGSNFPSNCWLIDLIILKCYIPLLYKHKRCASHKLNS